MAFATLCPHPSANGLLSLHLPPLHKRKSRSIGNIIQNQHFEDVPIGFRFSDRKFASRAFYPRPLPHILCYCSPILHALPHHVIHIPLCPLSKDRCVWTSLENTGVCRQTKHTEFEERRGVATYDRVQQLSFNPKSLLLPQTSPTLPTPSSPLDQRLVTVRCLSVW